jgi:hypothetical protein
MVQKKMGGEWVKMAKQRDKSNSDFISCEGRIEVWCMPRWIKNS